MKCLGSLDRSNDSMVARYSRYCDSNVTGADFYCPDNTARTYFYYLSPSSSLRLLSLPNQDQYPRYAPTTAALCAGAAWTAGALVRVGGRHCVGRGKVPARAWRKFEPGAWCALSECAPRLEAPSGVCAQCRKRRAALSCAAISPRGVSRCGASSSPGSRGCGHEWGILLRRCTSLYHQGDLRSDGTSQTLCSRGPAWP
jgi:hypothetical protein